MGENMDNEEGHRDEEGEVDMKLWVDDMRPPPQEGGWIWAKTVEEAMWCLKPQYLGENKPSLLRIEEMSIDHDLGEGKMTGYDLVTWIEGRVVRTNYVPPRITIHSANPVGRKNMEAGIRKIRELIEERG